MRPAPALISQKSEPALRQLYEGAIEANDWEEARVFADELQTRTGVDPTTRIANLFEESHFPSFMVSMLKAEERKLVLGLLKLFRTPENGSDLKKARALLVSRGQLSRAEIRAQVRENKKADNLRRIYMKNRATVLAKENKATLQPEKSLKQRKKEKIEALKKMTVFQLRRDAGYHICPQNESPFYPMPIWPDYIAKAFDDKLQSDRERAYLAICQRLVRQERSYLRTPVESFILRLLHQYQTDEVEPITVRRFVKDFEDKWNQAVDITKKLHEEYLVLRKVPIEPEATLEGSEHV